VFCSYALVKLRMSSSIRVSTDFSAYLQSRHKKTVLQPTFTHGGRHSVITTSVQLLYSEKSYHPLHRSCLSAVRTVSL